MVMRSPLAADLAAAVTAVREACPGTPVGVSTGLWITGGDPSARQSAVAAWADLPAAARPDFASVNLSEPGWAKLCGLEDTTAGPDGSAVSGNAELVQL